MKKVLFSILALAVSSAFGQQSKSFNSSNARSGETVEYCQQHTMEDAAMEDPVFKAQFTATQEMLKRELASGNSFEKNGTTYIIPVVFHILHNGGSENISNQQVFDAVRILNRDFRKQNADVNNVIPQFRGIAADVNIEFRLATIAPNGTCFNGITRSVTPLTVEGNGGGSQQLSYALNNNDVYRGEWDNKKYLNIIVAKEIGGAAGYTFRPSGDPRGYFNTIFILANYTGSIGISSENNSRSLTHEVGHWLNLPHTWGPNNNPGNMLSCTTDDGIADTPNTIGVSTCNLNENSCGVLANVENYMDYSYCSKMFTNGQVDVMRTAAAGYRASLISQSNLIAVGAVDNPTLCKVDFVAKDRVVCVGMPITFVDSSSNNVSSRTWDFPGGTASSTTGARVTVSYANAGRYTVKLTVNGNGPSLTETKTDYITVVQPHELPFYEGFEEYANGTAANNNWTLIESGVGEYEITSTAARTGQKSATISNYSKTGGEYSTSLISKPFDLESVPEGSVVLSFRTAFRKKTVSGASDNLAILMSRDCGQTWETKRTLTTYSLSQNQVVTSNWTPQPDDFVTTHLQMNSGTFLAYFTDQFRFRFQFKGGTGNNFFIDDINLYSGEPSDTPVLAVETLEAMSGVNLFPNPTANELNVAFNLVSPESVMVHVTDLTGKVISNLQINGNAGTNVLILDSSLYANGSYLLNLVTKTGRKTLSFVKM